MLVATPGLFSSQVHAQTGAPTTTFEGQNFTILEPKVTFHEDGGVENMFELDVEYILGKSVAYTSTLTLYRKDCENTDNFAELLDYHYGGYLNDGLNLVVTIVKAKIGKSPLGENADGYSQESTGSINFCIKIKGQMEITKDESVSVSFRKTNFRLEYDLTRNTFSVTNNNILADTVEETNTIVDTEYKVVAFRCGTGSSDFDDAEPGTINQNELVGICLKPTAPAVVKISTLDMFFQEQNNTVYTAATIKPVGPVSQHSVSSDGQTQRIVSRLVSKLFENGRDKFDVSGNAYLQFVSSRRMLEDILESTVGESSFSLIMKIEKVAGVGDSKGTKIFHAFPLIGAALTIAIGFVLYKKLA